MEKLNVINRNRKGEKCISEIDARIVHNDIYKKDITDDPLLRFFRAGANKDGYWSSSHAKLQLEDSIDYLKLLFPDHDFVVMYDQSSGHKKL